jgi:protoheme IX farnesyltransferase
VLSRILTITKPGIAGGVALSGLAGMTLAARGLPDGRTILLCTIFIVLAAAGSAILNVVFEANTDALMPRLSKRVEALSRIGTWRAAPLSIILIASSVIASYFLLNKITALLIISAAISYAFVYTLLLKKSSPYGTVTGGLPGAPYRRGRFNTLFCHAPVATSALPGPCAETQPAVRGCGNTGNAGRPG